MTEAGEINDIFRLKTFLSLILLFICLQTRILTVQLRNLDINRGHNSHLTITELLMPYIPITSARFACSQDASAEATAVAYAPRCLWMQNHENEKVLCEAKHRLKSQKIKDTADTMILNCWPELVALADNCLSPLLSLSAKKPALTNTWQINM